MRIKRIFLTSLLFFLPFVLIVLINFSINILIKDFDYSRKSHNVYVPEVNWAKYYYAINKKKITNYFFNLTSDEKGLPRVDIYVPEKTSRALLSAVPHSTKQYLDVEIIINNQKIKASMRYLGDNPMNWMFYQKNIRLKLKKSKLLNQKRYFEYVSWGEGNLERYTAFKLAKKLDLLVSDVKMVELFVNDKSLGIYIERERLNESFLRRNKIMPINLYKGEAYKNSEKKIGLAFYLDQNPGLWEKISFFNAVDENDYTDLVRFFNNIKKAQGSNSELNKILKHKNLDLFARASILEVITNNAANGDYIHNRRMAIDPWSGNVHLIPHDFVYTPTVNDEKNYSIDKSFMNLFDVLHQSSKFLDYKYSLLYKLVKEDKIFDEIINDLKSIEDKYLISKKTDFGSINPVKPINKNSEKNYDLKFNETVNSLKKTEKKIIDFLEGEVKASWEVSKKGFIVKIEKSLPASNLEVKFGKKSPKWIALDYNNNQIVDKDDKYFFPTKTGKFTINLKFFANRILLNQNKLSVENKIITDNTKFTFFVEAEIKPSQLVSFNDFTKKKLILDFNNESSTNPITNNVALLKKEQKKIRFGGKVFINNDLIVNQETEILEGTTFFMGKGASIVFENKVKAIGSDKKPIIFKSFESNSNWGTVAIHGPKTYGSKFKNIIIEDASGKSINGVNYFAALAIHSASNIKFDNILVKNNAKFDDMMHIIYSDNIQILNSKFLNAHKDSIDVDISNNILFKNTTISHSGNDGLDLMESKVELQEVKISFSGDKGVSVGENSYVLINDSIINSNKFGIASKDLSKAIINNSFLQNNNIQLSVYKKNWRYGGSGIIEIKNSKISALKNNFNSDEDGDISISSTVIDGTIYKPINVKVN